MKNFLAMHENLLKLVKNEAAESTMLIISNIFKENQLAFENHLKQQLSHKHLSMSQKLDMQYKIYQLS